MKKAATSATWIAVLRSGLKRLGWYGKLVEFFPGIIDVLPSCSSAGGDC